MAQELQNRPSGYRYAVQAHLNLMLLDIRRFDDGPDGHDNPTLADPLLGAAFEFIERCYARPISA
jgi:hypothetical protein